MASDLPLGGGGYKINDFRLFNNREPLLYIDNEIWIRQNHFIIDVENNYPEATPFWETTQPHQFIPVETPELQNHTFIEGVSGKGNYILRTPYQLYIEDTFSRKRAFYYNSTKKSFTNGIILDTYQDFSQLNSLAYDKENSIVYALLRNNSDLLKLLKVDYKTGAVTELLTYQANSNYSCVFLDENYLYINESGSARQYTKSGSFVQSINHGLSPVSSIKYNNGIYYAERYRTLYKTTDLSVGFTSFTSATSIGFNSPSNTLCWDGDLLYWKVGDYVTRCLTNDKVGRVIGHQINLYGYGYDSKTRTNSEIATYMRIL